MHSARLPLLRVSARRSKPRIVVLMFVQDLRSTLARRGDQLFVGAVGIVALAASHVLLSDRPLSVVTGLGLAASALCGLGVAGLAHRRLKFHGSDGSLAAQALCPAARRDYSLALHLVAVAPVMIVALIARPEAMLAVPFGYLAGAFVGHGLQGVLPDGGVRPQGLIPRGIRTFLGRPIPER